MLQRNGENERKMEKEIHSKERLNPPFHKASKAGWAHSKPNYYIQKNKSQKKSIPYIKTKRYSSTQKKNGAKKIITRSKKKNHHTVLL